MPEPTHSPVESRLGFRLMAAGFRIRDVFRPPARLLREAGVRPGDAVLDFGCGPGSFSLAAARLVGESGRVYALDLHPLAVRTVAKRAERRGFAHLFAFFSDTDTGLPAESMDLILLYDVLHEVKDRSGLFEEFHRLLKPGGRVSFHDHYLDREAAAGILTAGGRFRLLREGKSTLTFQKI